MAGDVRPDTGYSVHITRQAEWGSIPLAAAKVDPRRPFQHRRCPAQVTHEAPKENIPAKPYDMITVPRAQMGM